MSMTDRMRWRSILSAWASRRYRGKHRHGLSVATIAARLGDFAGDECVTQLLPREQSQNVVRRADAAFDVPTVEFAKVPAWEVA